MKRTRSDCCSLLAIVNVDFSFRFIMLLYFVLFIVLPLHTAPSCSTRSRQLPFVLPLHPYLSIFVHVNVRANDYYVYGLYKACSMPPSSSDFATSPAVVFPIHLYVPRSLFLSVEMAVCLYESSCDATLHISVCWLEYLQVIIYKHSSYSSFSSLLARKYLATDAWQAALHHTECLPRSRLLRMAETHKLCTAIAGRRGRAEQFVCAVQLSARAQRELLALCPRNQRAWAHRAAQAAGIATPTRHRQACLSGRLSR